MVCQAFLSIFSGENANPQPESNGGAEIYPRVGRFFGSAQRGYIAPGLRPDAETDLGYMLRACSTRSTNKRKAMTRTMKKRETITREEMTFYMSFSHTTECEIFAPQQQTGAEHNDISCETIIAPAQWRAKTATRTLRLRRAESLLRRRQRRLRTVRQKTPLQIKILLKRFERSPKAAKTLRKPPKHGDCGRFEISGLLRGKISPSGPAICKKIECLRKKQDFAGKIISDA